MKETNQKKFIGNSVVPAVVKAWAGESKSLGRQFDKLINECKKVVKY